MNQNAMSYQFEDDSALEELLNQQLNQQRRQQSALVTSSTGRRQASSTGVSQQRRPSTAIISERPEDRQLESGASLNPSSAGGSKSKLASWLDGGGKGEENINLPERGYGDAQKVPFAPQAPTKKPVDQSNEDVEDEENLEDEERLRNLSKQHLVSLIRTKLAKKIREFNSRDKEHELRLRQLQGELEEASRQLISARSSESMMRQQVDKQATTMIQIEEEHKRQLEQLAEGYKKQLADEKANFELTLRRRDEFHRLELESKLKVNIEVRELETTFAEWQSMIKSTIEEMNLQYKSVESLLSKQSAEINGSNSKLANKTKALIEAHEKFELRGQQLDKLANQLSNMLAQLGTSQSMHEQLLERTNERLERLLESDREFKAREMQLESCRIELASERQQLDQERLQVAIELNKLEYKEQSIDKLMETNELQQSRLDGRQRELETCEAEVRQLHLNLEAQAKQMRDQNYQLHLSRRRLVEKGEQLRAKQAQLEKQMGQIDSQKVKVRRGLAELEALRGKVGREMNQLRRLERSLVCSICNESLFAKSAALNQIRSSGDQIEDRNLWPLTSDKLKAELADLMGHIELDGRRLDAENEFVDGLVRSAAS